MRPWKRLDLSQFRGKNPFRKKDIKRQEITHVAKRDKAQIVRVLCNTRLLAATLSNPMLPILVVKSSTFI